MKKVKIQENDKNQTLIKFLEKYLKGAPKSVLQKLIRTKKVKVNGKRAEASYMLEKGDILDVYVYDEVIEEWNKKASKNTVSNKLSLDIAYENKDIVIIDKPVNVLSHAASKEDYGSTVVDFLVSYLIEKKEYIPRLEHSFTPAIVNRLDRNTKGLIIGAKNRETLLELNKAIDTNQIEKYYLAIVHGNFKGEKEIVNYLEKDETNVVRVSQSQEGKKSITKVKAIISDDDYSLVEIKLETGRTHQIRASLNDLGFPIVGDRKYFNNDVRLRNVKHQQLVAYKLKFSKDISVESLRDVTVESGFGAMVYNTYNKLGGE